MEDHEVKYIPTNGSNFLPSKCKQWIQLKNKRSNSQLSLFISVLSLVVALCFFALLFTWLWQVPEKVAENEKKINSLEDVIENNPSVYDSGARTGQNLDSICSQDKTEGNCFASMPRWYYDKHLKSCKQFEYTGCNGNQNNFHTEDFCLSSCGDHYLSAQDRSSPVAKSLKQKGESCGFSRLDDCGNCDQGLECDTFAEDACGVCILKSEENLKQEGEECGPCFNPDLKFHCGTCSSGLECKEDPVSGPALPDLPNKCRKGKAEELKQKEINCSEEPDAGMCRALIPRFYHDKNDGECKQFYWGGCGGNTNNFLTTEDCETKCKFNDRNGDMETDAHKSDKSFCKLPFVVGDCRAAIPRWYYNEASKKCEEFTWGGCDGNQNNFASREKCESRCKDAVSNDNNEPKSSEIISDPSTENESTGKGSRNKICYLPEDGGKCRAIMEKYLFNQNTNKCELFQYGGCGGNENRFETIQECEKACVLT